MVAVLPETDAGVKRQMDQEKTEVQEWPGSEDEDSVGEVIRYTLDEIRFA